MTQNTMETTRALSFLLPQNKLSADLALTIIANGESAMQAITLKCPPD